MKDKNPGEVEYESLAGPCLVLRLLYGYVKMQGSFSPISFSPVTIFREQPHTPTHFTKNSYCKSRNRTSFSFFFETASNFDVTQPNIDVFNDGHVPTSPV